MDALQARTLALLLGTGTASWSHASLTHTTTNAFCFTQHQPMNRFYPATCFAVCSTPNYPANTQLSPASPLPRFPAPPPREPMCACVLRWLFVKTGREGGREGGRREGGRVGG